MELREFITQSITQIMAGVSDAQTHALEMGGAINPVSMILDKDDKTWRWIKTDPTFKTDPYGRIVEFDIALVVQRSGSSEGSMKGKIGIPELGLGVGADLADKTEDLSSNTSRIKFSIPIFFHLQQK